MFFFFLNYGIPSCETDCTFVVAASTFHTKTTYRTTHDINCRRNMTVETVNAMFDITEATLNIYAARHHDAEAKFLEHCNQDLHNSHLAVMFVERVWKRNHEHAIESHEEGTQHCTLQN